MKILQIGAGGIGSFLAKELFDHIDKGYCQVPIDVVIHDFDSIEVDQVMYQNFTIDEAGLNKAICTGHRYGFTASKKKIDKESYLLGYDLIVLAVDNDKTRAMVTEWCHKNDCEFIDLRATGRRVFAMPKENTLQENMKFIDSKDFNSYSCQDKQDLEKGLLQVGNKVAAIIGLQMILNFTRGHNNRIINLII